MCAKIGMVFLCRNRSSIYFDNNNTNDKINLKTMKLPRQDMETLLRSGIEIVGEFLRIEDFKNKVTHEFALEEIGQLTLKRRFLLSLTKKSKLALVIHKWDTSRVIFDVPESSEEELKSALKKVNIFFYAES